MELTELDPRALTADAAEAIAEVQMAVRRAELPDPTPSTGASVRLFKRHGVGDDRPDWLTVGRAAGRIVAVATLLFPRQANRHLAYLWIDVHPGYQRRGIGSELLRRAEDRTRAEGRRSVTGFTLRDGSGAGFAKARGFRPGLDNAMRRLELADADPAGWVEQRSAAMRHAGEYELVRVLGPSDDTQVADLTALYAAINDAPTGDLDVEPEPYDVSSIRAYERAQTDRGRTIYHVLARRRRDSAWAGHTIALVDRHLPTWAGQEDTSVLPEHRGHRLGLAMKADLLAWLAEAEPQLRWIQTWNAESNRHMLAVNETLGFTLVARTVQQQKALPRH